MLLRVLVLLVAVGFCFQKNAVAQTPAELFANCSSYPVGCEAGMAGIETTYVTTYRQGPPQYAFARIVNECKGVTCNGGPVGSLGVAYTSISLEDFLSEKPTPPSQCGATAAGSIIGINNRTLGEKIKIVGTNFDLVYTSERVFGYKNAYRVNTRINGSPSGAANQVIVWDETDTIVESQSYAVYNNVYHTYEWDGLDASSNETWAS